MGTAPDALLRLVDRFDQDRKVFQSGNYKEEQLRLEFLNPFFPALGQVYEQFLGKVIRLTAGHQAKVEEKPEGHLPAREVDIRLRLGNMTAMQSERPAFLAVCRVRRRIGFFSLFSSGLCKKQ